MAEIKRPADTEPLARRIARAGMASRREAARWIEAGRVTVDGESVTLPGHPVTAGADIRVDGEKLKDAEPARLWRYHKPRGLVTTHSDPEGRPTVFSSLPPTLPRVMSVGRLDLDSEGLLLLTNDGALARKMELPATGWVRRYRLRMSGTPKPGTIKRLAEGVKIEDVQYGPIEMEIDRPGRNCWITAALREGKNRELRKVFEHLGHPVSRLIRVSYGPFQLGELARGDVREVPRKVLKEQLGLS